MPKRLPITRRLEYYKVAPLMSEGLSSGNPQANGGNQGRCTPAGRGVKENGLAALRCLQAATDAG